MKQNHNIDKNTNSKSIIIRKFSESDIPQIVKLQTESFADMAKYGMIFPSSFLRNHIKLFPDGQLLAESDGRIVGSSSSLIVSLGSEYEAHSWFEITGNGLFTNHNPHGDTLYGADISTHPDFRSMGIGTMLYDARKELAKKLNLRRILAGGRLFDYCQYSQMMSAKEYADKVIHGELSDPVLSFQLKNGFKFIKVLDNYLFDKRSLNYASLIEWVNPSYHILANSKSSKKV
ncbi:MAG TPA: GNAT family N-acetyltransferase [Nitrososphaeraceae archaeon]|jgi:ribosomal protein S18 acetylase RimI-like enzyme